MLMIFCQGTSKNGNDGVNRCFSGIFGAGGLALTMEICLHDFVTLCRQYLNDLNLEVTELTR